MKILVQPQKGGTYKLLFYDGRHTKGAAFVELTETPRGPRGVSVSSTNAAPFTDLPS